MNPVKINSDRLWQSILESGKIGASHGGGLNRPAFSLADMEVRKWFVRKLGEAGLEVRVDPALNIIGRLNSKRETAKVGLVCSHLDTVPNGGMFDGVLGVLSGLECIKSIKENDIQLPWHLDLVNFSDEEGAFKVGTMGSRAMAGTLDQEAIWDLNTSESFSRGLKQAGGDPKMLRKAECKLKEIQFCLELHIEQGPVLEHAQKDIGIVTGIAGIKRMAVQVDGRADHAGTTPMSLRRDALMKSLPIIAGLPKIVREQYPEMVQTIGVMNLEPGAVNVVPEKCRFIIELRSQKEADLIAVREQIRQYERRDIVIKDIYDKSPVLLDKSMMSAIEAATDGLGYGRSYLPSGAGHDAQTFAPYLPTGMIFVPCRDGSSHCPREWASQKACTRGANTMLHTILTLSCKNFNLCGWG